MPVTKVNIVEAGNDVLRQRAGDVPSRLMHSQELKDFVGIMIAAMRDAPGVGLAAPQLGVPLRIIVFRDVEDNTRYLTTRERQELNRTPVGPEAWINPSFRPLSEKKVKFFEGCLSVPGLQAVVERFEEIELGGLDEDGQRKEPLKLSGWPARIVQHEIDHLDGILYVDRMDSKTLATQGSLARQGMEDLKALLGLPLSGDGRFGP
jgi:peptide deformylase